MDSSKVYSVQARRFGGWLACSGTEAKKSYRVVALTSSWDDARLMASTQCVCPKALAEIRRIAAASVVPDQPIDLRPEAGLVKA